MQEKIMKNSFWKLLLLLLSLSLTLCLFACNVETPDSGNGGNEDENGENDDGNKPDEGGNTADSIDWGSLETAGKMAIISQGIARFQVVYTTEAGSTGIREAENLVKTLRDLGVTVADAVSDKDAANVKDCEIIIGTGARHRGDEVNVNSKYLGEKGLTIKIVGTRIVIAGGSAAELKTAINYYVKNEMDISSKTTEIKELAVDNTYFQEKLTTYLIESITVNGVDLREYTVIEDFASVTDAGYAMENVRNFREELYSNSGYWLDYGTLENIDSYEHKVIFRYNTDMDESGFNSYIDDNGDWIIECAYANAFDNAYYAFMKTLIFGQVKPEINIPGTLNYKKRVCEVTYEEFGAVGDGETDDFQALYDTHVYANAGGQKVLGSASARYYVKHLPYTIPVKTNVDFQGATIIVNDKGSDEYKTRGVSLFTFERDYAGVILNEADIDKIEASGVDITLDIYIDENNPGTTSLPWLAEYIEYKSYVLFKNSHHKDVIRHGSNETKGEDRRDVFIMYPDGSIDPETEVCFEFDDITRIEIYRVDDAPIVFENGNFINQCCEVVTETNFDNKYHAYERGLNIHRSNVTIRNIHHEMEDEPFLDTSVSQWGTLHESYPYYAFILTENTYNLLVEDCQITGHTTYYQDKEATSSTNGKPNPVAQGTYDICVEESIGVVFRNVVQIQALDNNLGDNRYWGIMSSNWSKDTEFHNCQINRFDAHRTFWGAKLVDTTIGHSINLVGGGELYMENVTKLVTDYFITTRSDYGGTFRGNITLVDCRLDGVSAYNSTLGGVYDPTNKAKYGTVIKIGFSNNNNTGYWDWDFGYDCYMPKNVVLDNFTSGTTDGMYVFNSLVDDVFTTIAKPLVKTETVTFRNMESFAICPYADTYAEMNAITIVNEGYTKEEE